MKRLLDRVRLRRRVSEEWLLDHERREMGQGVELPCIDWDAMKNRFSEPQPASGEK